MSAPLQSPPWNEGWLEGLSRDSSDICTYRHTDTHNMHLYTYMYMHAHILLILWHTHTSAPTNNAHTHVHVHARIRMYTVYPFYIGIQVLTQTIQSTHMYVSTYTRWHWDTPHTVSRYQHSSSLSHTETDTEGSSWRTPSPETVRGQVSLVMFVHNTQQNNTQQHNTTTNTSHNDTTTQHNNTTHNTQPPPD